MRNPSARPSARRSTWSATSGRHGSLPEPALEQQDGWIGRGNAGLAKAELAIERLRRRHAGQRVEAHARVADAPRLGHGGQRQRAAEPAAARNGAHIEALHLAQLRAIPAPAAAPRSRPAPPLQARAPGSSLPRAARSRRASPPARPRNSGSTARCRYLPRTRAAAPRSSPDRVPRSRARVACRCMASPNQRSEPGACGEHAERQRGAPIEPALLARPCRPQCPKMPWPAA